VIFEPSEKECFVPEPANGRPCARFNWKGGNGQLKPIKQLLDLIERVFAFLAMTSVFIMACLTSADAAGRYLLNWPITGAYEITENYLMVFTVYFALAYAYSEGANVRITLLISRFPSQVKLAVHYFTQIFSLLFVLFLFVSATVMNLGRLGDVVQLTKKVSLPVWPAYLIISLGLLFTGLLVFLDLRAVKNQKSGLLKVDSVE
jgi:TRAP-type C4-dicarboxylate transport system permease small subunit